MSVLASRHATTVAVLLAVGIGAAMLATSGAARAVLVLVGAAAQVGVVLAARPHGRPPLLARAAVLGSVQAGLTWLVAGEPTSASVLVYLGVGVVFAVLALAVLAVVGRTAPTPASTGPTDTAPLPVLDGGGPREDDVAREP